MDLYHPPQIKRKELITYAAEFNLTNSDLGGEEFVNFVIQRDDSKLSAKQSRHWCKDAYKALKYVRTMTMLKKPIPELANSEEEFSDDKSSYVTYPDTNRMNRMLSGRLTPKVNQSLPLESPEGITDTPELPKKKKLKRKLNDTQNEESKESEFQSRFQCTCPTKTIEDVQKGLPHSIVKSIYEFSWMRLSGFSSSTSVRSSVLLRGPPGCGKSTLITALAGTLKANLMKLSVVDILSQGGGGLQSSKLLKSVFKKAKDNAPCILHLEDMDLFPSKMSKSGTSMCGLLKDLLDDHKSDRVLLIGETTSHLAELDSGLLQLFVAKLTFGMMEETARHSILEDLLSTVQLEEGVTTSDMARRTPGFEIGDLVILVSTMTDRALSTSLPFLSPLPQTLIDPPAVRVGRREVEMALLEVVPLAKQSPGFVTVPDVTWDDIGGQTAAKEQIENNFLSIVNDSAGASKLGRRSDGILLIGPPGCGKTLMAKALSNKAGLNFISVKGPEIFDKYLGESERKIRVIFERARACQPCLIFFDEIDAICSRRNDEGSGRTGVVNMLLTELDGLESRGECQQRVFVMAATNRVDAMDEAILRAGRLGTQVHVTPPTSSQDRVAVLDALTRGGSRPRVEDKDNVFMRTAADTRAHRFSGAAFDSLLERAKQHAHVHKKRDYLCMEDLDWALTKAAEEEMAEKMRQKTRKRRRETLDESGQMPLPS